MLTIPNKKPNKIKPQLTANLVQPFIRVFINRQLVVALFDSEALVTYCQESTMVNLNLQSLLSLTFYGRKLYQN